MPNFEIESRVTKKIEKKKNAEDPRSVVEENAERKMEENVCQKARGI